MKNLTMNLSIEASELMEIVLWMTDQETQTLPQNPQLMEHIRDEIGDVFHALLRICTLLNIDLGEAFLTKLQKTEAKYPIALCKGQAQKYSLYLK
jgi:NTP pyrophosphatase (non-canonical NTP hydrolase)